MAILPRKITDKISSYYFKKIRGSVDWFILHLPIVSKCNLNCASCSTFSPIAYEYYADIFTLKTDCKRLSDLGNDKIPEIHILGGEPLLHPQLNTIIEIVRQYFNNAKIKIITNGILLSAKDDLFWNCLKENKTDITVSHYPIDIKIKEIRATARKFNVNIRYYRGKLPWFKGNLDPNGNYDSSENFKKCDMPLCCTNLHEGKISTCNIISKIQYLNNYFSDVNFEVNDTDYIDIYKVKSIDEIIRFITKPVPFCRYCALKTIPIKWSRSKKEIHEWI